MKNMENVFSAESDDGIYILRMKMVGLFSMQDTESYHGLRTRAEFGCVAGIDIREVILETGCFSPADYDYFN